MKRIAYALLLFLTVSAGADTKPSILPINQFSGLNTDDSALTLQNGQTPDSENVVTDEGPGIQGRQGFTLCQASSATAIWVFSHSNGTRYQIIQSGGVLKADTGVCTFSITVSTVDASVATSASSLGDKFFFTNLTDGLKYWDSSTVAVASSAIKATQLVTYKSRLWASGIATSPRTIFASAFNDGTSWNLVTNPAVTDPAQFVIGGAVDQPLTTLYASHQNQLVWMKAQSFGTITGESRRDFSVRTVSENVGTSYPTSVRDCDGVLRFLGPLRSIYEWDGASLHNIGLKIKGYLAQVGQGDANSRTWVQTTQADFQAAALGTGLSATDSPGDVLFADVLIDDFSDTDYTNNPTWTVNEAVHGSWSALSGSLRFNGDGIGQGTGEIYYDYGISTGAVSMSVNFPNTFFLFGIQMSSTTLTPEGTSWGSVCGGNGYLATVAGGTNLISIKKCSSGVMSTLVSSIAPTSAIGSHTIIFDRNSAGVLTVFWDGTATATATDTTFSNMTKINVVFVCGGLSDAFITFDVKFKYYSATYQSPAFNVGSNITSWGTFSATTSGDGSQAFVLYTDTNSAITLSNPATFTSSQTITSGSYPTVATAAYVTVTDSFSRTASTQTPTLASFSLSWNEGTTTAAPSAWYRQRYWLGLTRNSSTNNRVLVYDRSGQWQSYNGINASAFNIYNGTLFFGNSSGVYQYETGYSDNGSAIASYYRTASFPASGPDLISTYRDLIPTTENSGSTLATTFQVDGVNTDYSLGNWVMNTNAGYQNFRLPFPISQVQQGKYINFKFSVSGTVFWRMVGANLYFMSDLFPK